MGDKFKVKVAMANNFFNAFAALPRRTQTKVSEFIFKFESDSTSKGINFEKVKNATDDKMFSARVDDDYRIILVIQKDQGIYLLVHVAKHDDAYRWAVTRKCRLNQLGAIQIYETQFNYNNEVTESKESIFKDYTDEQLLSIGVPKEQLYYTKSLSSKEQFYSSQDSYSPDTFEYLSWIVNGNFSIDEVLELLQSNLTNQDSSETNFEIAINNPINKSSFYVIEGEESLKKILDAPLEKWRVFLHPMQRQIVETNYSGSAKILGSAGTGKTVVALHRAKFLASHLKENQKLLFTTFTTNLATDISQNLLKICTKEEYSHIEVTNLDQWVNSFFNNQQVKTTIIYDDKTIEDLWKESITSAAIDPDLDFDWKFYKEEWERVVVENEAFSKDLYISARRIGRSKKLDRKTKLAIWNVFDTYINNCNQKNIKDIYFAMYEAKQMLKKEKNDYYEHIIVDEAQDLSNVALRLLRSMVKEKSDDLFIVGDAHQRIYKQKQYLSKCGIYIRGRSKTLKINYRTTEEIRKYAIAALKECEFDDLDGNKLKDLHCQSLTHGSYPIVKHFSDQISEQEFIKNEILNLKDQNINLSNICIVARTNELVEVYKKYLINHGIKTNEIKKYKADDDTNTQDVRIATMHRVKGLEFQYIFIVAMNEEYMPLRSIVKKLEGESLQETIISEKSLLYVSLTRAQKIAYVTSFKKQSKFLS